MTSINQQSLGESIDMTSREHRQSTLEEELSRPARKVSIPARTITSIQLPTDLQRDAASSWEMLNAASPANSWSAPSHRSSWDSGEVPVDLNKECTRCCRSPKTAPNEPRGKFSWNLYFFSLFKLGTTPSKAPAAVDPSIKYKFDFSRTAYPSTSAAMDRWMTRCARQELGIGFDGSLSDDGSSTSERSISRQTIVDDRVFDGDHGSRSRWLEGRAPMYALQKA